MKAGERPSAPFLLRLLGARGVAVIAALCLGRKKHDVVGWFESKFICIGLTFSRALVQYFWADAGSSFKPSGQGI